MRKAQARKVDNAKDQVMRYAFEEVQCSPRPGHAPRIRGAGRMATSPSNAAYLREAPTGLETLSGLRVPMRTSRAPHSQMTPDEYARAVLRQHLAHHHLDEDLRPYVCDSADAEMLAFAVDRLRHALAGDCRIVRCTLIPIGSVPAREAYMTARGEVPFEPEHPVKVKVIPDKGPVYVYEWDALVQLVATGRL